MRDRYKNIRHLIELWEEYEEQSYQIDMTSFSEWLSLHVKSNPEPQEKVGSNRFKNISLVQNLKNYDDPTRFLEYISRIARLHEFYTRKFLEGLPINSRLEFLFLHTVNNLGQTKKTELISSLLVEYSTGMDTIKRLINTDLLSEIPNETDKRVKLLEVTQKGKEILSISEKRLKEERVMLLACISTNKWKKTMPLLEEIYDFHNSVYLNHNDKPYSELLNLMDSLKYLYR